jgi:hypothetical protein
MAETATRALSRTAGTAARAPNLMERAARAPSLMARRAPNLMERAARAPSLMERRAARVPSPTARRGKPFQVSNILATNLTASPPPSRMERSPPNLTEGRTTGAIDPTTEVTAPTIEVIDPTTEAIDPATRAMENLRRRATRRRVPSLMASLSPRLIRVF